MNDEEQSCDVEYNKVAQQWQEKVDFAIAQDLQTEEFTDHHSANRQERRLARQSTQEALRLVAEQERTYQELRADEMQNRAVAASVQAQLDEEQTATVEADAALAERLQHQETMEQRRRANVSSAGAGAGDGDDERLARALQEKELRRATVAGIKAEPRADTEADTDAEIARQLQRLEVRRWRRAQSQRTSGEASGGRHSRQTDV